MAFPTLGHTPLVTPWLRAAQSLAAPWGSLWTGELARQQIEMMTEFNRQALRAWSAAWSFAPGGAASPADDAEMAAAGSAPSPMAPVVQAVPLPPAPRAGDAPVTVPVQAAAAPAVPDSPAPARKTKPAAPLRTTAPRRKPGPISVGPRRGGPGKTKGATRH